MRLWKSARYKALKCTSGSFSIGYFLEEARDRFDHFVIHGAIAGDGFEQRDGDDFVGAQGSHASEFAAVNHVDSAQAVTGGEDAVEGAGRAAALDVSEDHGTGFEAGTLFDFAGEDVGDATEFNVAKLVLAHVRSEEHTSELQSP